MTTITPRFNGLFKLNYSTYKHAKKIMNLVENEAMSMSWEAPFTTKTKKTIEFFPKGERPPVSISYRSKGGQLTIVGDVYGTHPEKDENIKRILDQHAAKYTYTPLKLIAVPDKQASKK